MNSYQHKAAENRRRDRLDVLSEWVAIVVGIAATAVIASVSYSVLFSNSCAVTGC